MHICQRKQILFLLSAGLFFLPLITIADTISTPSAIWLAIESGYFISQTPTHVTTKQEANYIPTAMANNGFYSIGGGYQFNGANINSADVAWFPATRSGLFYQNIPETKLSGYVQQSPVNDTVYNYQYKINSSVLWLDEQLDILSWQRLTPYIEVGIGSAYNGVNSFESSAANSEFNNAPQFANHAQWTLAYRFGAGLSYQFPWFQGRFHLELAYRHSALGQASTGDSATTSGDGGLNTHLYNNEIVFGIRAFAS